MSTRFSQFIPRQRWARWTIVALVTLLVVWLATPRLAAPYVRSKLQAMIASRLAAELQMSSLSYLPPFGVRIHDAKLVAKENGTREVELLKFDRLDLRLAKLPFGDGPLVIERIEVQGPQLHLIRTEQGLVGALSFAHAPGEPTPQLPQHQQQQQQHVPAGTKLSDMFELRHFALQDGKVVLEDRTRPGSVPMVWSGLNANSDTTPTSRAEYTFEFKGDHSGVAALNARGSFNIDALHFRVHDSSAAITAEAGQSSSAMPAEIQSVLRKHRIAGKVGIRGHADLPFRDLASAKFDVDVQISDGSAHVARTGVPLERLNLSLHCGTVDPAPATSAPGTAPATRLPILVRLDQFEALGGGGARLVFGDDGSPKRPTLLVDRAANHWQFADFAGLLDLGSGGGGDLDRPTGRLGFAARATGPLVPPDGRTMLQSTEYHATLRPQGVRVRPPKAPLPFEGVGGEDARVELHPGVLAFKNIHARYGKDEILLRSARMPIPDDIDALKRAFALDEIDGRVTFRHPSEEYPGKFNKVIEQLRPAGPFEIGGGSFFHVNSVEWDAVDAAVVTASGLKASKRKGDWFFSISTDAGSLTLTDNDLTLADITGDATVSNMLIDVTRLQCSVLGGRGVASGKIVPTKPFLVQEGRVALREIDLAVVARTFQPDKPSEKLSGRAFLNFTFDGSLGSKGGYDAADLLRGRGEFEVIEGDFWTLPLFGRVASEAKRKNSNLTLGEAAGVFRIADRSLFLENAAVSSPALGLIGSGRIGFDKALELKIVAAPLGDWRDRIKQGRIPIVSNVAGEIVGGVQKLLNTATGTLLYQFRVTGDVGDPKVQTVPAPVLTDPAALLFGRMLDDQRKHRLIDSVRTESR